MISIKSYCLYKMIAFFRVMKGEKCIEQYSRLTDDVEMKSDEADRQAAQTDQLMTHDEVFLGIRKQLKNGRKL